ncbi:MAG: hypothetical protein AABX75_02500 [Nanoarchaeota archaeon]
MNPPLGAYPRAKARGSKKIHDGFSGPAELCSAWFYSSSPNKAGSSYFNIVTAAGIAIIFATIWSYFIDKIQLGLLLWALLIGCLIFLLPIMLINSKLNNITEEIRKL